MRPLNNAVCAIVILLLACNGVCLAQHGGDTPEKIKQLNEKWAANMRLWGFHWVDEEIPMRLHRYELKEGYDSPFRQILKRYVSSSDSAKAGGYKDFAIEMKYYYRQDTTRMCYAIVHVARNYDPKDIFGYLRIGRTVYYLAGDKDFTTETDEVRELWLRTCYWANGEEKRYYYKGDKPPEWFYLLYPHRVMILRNFIGYYYE